MSFFWVGEDQAQTPLLGTLQELGLTSGLKLCLDAADIVSWPGSGQKWLDTAGSGYDFFLGTDGTSQSSDPTFNGTVGNLSSGEYFGFDGGDAMTYDTTAETWMNNLHKDNAVFTMLAWVYPVAGSGGGIFGDQAGATTSPVGISWRITSANVLRFNGANGSASIINQSTSATVTGSAWNFIAVSLTEASSALVMQVNATQESISANYSSPSSSAAGLTPQIGALGSTAQALASGSRLAAFAAWEGVALTTTQLESIRSATRERFGV